MNIEVIFYVFFEFNSSVISTDIDGDSFDEKYYIYVSDEENNQEIDIGKNGIVYFITKDKDENNIFNGNNLEEKTQFKTTITDINSNNYDVICRLWKPINENIRIFCELNKDITSQNIKLNSSSLKYNHHKIEIISQMNFFMKIKQLGTIIPFIYSDKQTIEIEKENNSYEIKLKVLEYNNEQLILLNPQINNEEEMNNKFLDNCNHKENNLICQISKEKIEQILGYSGQEFRLNYLDSNRGILGELRNIFNIKINYNSIEKENIYIGITKLLGNKLSTNNYIAYETNVTSMDNIITNKFLYNNIPCLMKKDTEKPLLMICKFVNEGEKYIGKITEEIKLNNISIKYNLLIQPRDTEDKIEIKGNSGTILFAYPMELDFTLNDKLSINYYINNNEYYNSVRINPDSNNDLECENLGNIKKCNVRKEHFLNTPTGYYYTYHKNDFGEFSISPELSPIR